MKSKIRSLLLEIYCCDNIESYLLSLSLRSDHPMVHKECNKIDDYNDILCKEIAEGHKSYIGREKNDSNYWSAWRDEQALIYINNYHFSTHVRETGDSITEMFADENYIEAVNIAQKYVVGLLIQHNVGVETNPTSNYLIGPVEDFEDVPALKMLGLFHGSEHYRDLRISIGNFFFTAL